ncbi:MAG TPA: VOC family protein [Hanamia sp.]|nr:VOC family protein [Hanamia sp.]
MQAPAENKSENRRQKIVPFLWFDDNAEEAVNFYISCFKNSKAGSISRYDEASAKASGRPEGSVLTESFQLNGQEFIALNGGPVFKFTPCISFFVTCETEEQLDALWKKLSEGGITLMELNSYPFSKKYGWVQDKFGLSWQLNFTGDKQKINPLLMFTGNQAGNAEEAIHFYVSLFKNSEIVNIVHYQKGQGEPEGNVVHARFSLNGEEFMAMDSSIKHEFNFTPAVSFMVYCETQAEVDYFWKKLTEGGKEVECGWLEDKYGVSWQIVPTIFIKLITQPDKEKAKRVMQAMMKMKKFDIKTLEEA